MRRWRGVCSHLSLGCVSFPIPGIWRIHSPRHQTLLQQVGRDDNVRTLLEAIRDTFEFAKEAAVLRNIQPGSMQVKVLDEMLQCVAKSAEFVESYAKDVQIGTSS
jgi:hypothetical protein